MGGFGAMGGNGAPPMVTMGGIVPPPGGFMASMGSPMPSTHDGIEDTTVHHTSASNTEISKDNEEEDGREEENEVEE